MKKGYEGDVIFASRNNLESILQWRFLKRNTDEYLNRTGIKFKVGFSKKYPLQWELVDKGVNILLSRSGNGGNVVMDIEWGDIFKFGDDEFIFCFQF